MNWQMPPYYTDALNIVAPSLEQICTGYDIVVEDRNENKIGTIQIQYCLYKVIPLFKFNIAFINSDSQIIPLLFGFTLMVKFPEHKYYLVKME